MQRVLVLGPPGAGKSRFARRLGERTGLPVIHIDQLFWESGWKPATPDDYVERLREAVAGERWVIDGNYVATLELRVPRADAIVLLDCPRWISYVRVLRRWIASYGKVRPDMAPGCPERFDREFLRYIWRYRRHYRPRTLAAIDRHRAWSRTVVARGDFGPDDLLAARKDEAR